MKRNKICRAYAIYKLHTLAHMPGDGKFCHLSFDNPRLMLGSTVVVMTGYTLEKSIKPKETTNIVVAFTL